MLESWRCKTGVPMTCSPSFYRPGAAAWIAAAIGLLLTGYAAQARKPVAVQPWQLKLDFPRDKVADGVPKQSRIYLDSTINGRKWPALEQPGDERYLFLPGRISRTKVSGRMAKALSEGKDRDGFDAVVVQFAVYVPSGIGAPRYSLAIHFEPEGDAPPVDNAPFFKDMHYALVRTPKARMNGGDFNGMSMETGFARLEGNKRVCLDGLVGNNYWSARGAEQAWVSVLFDAKGYWRDLAQVGRPINLVATLTEGCSANA